jgi:glycosyltransferase involved in cell wall biosynthesis
VKIALVVTGGLHPSGREQVMPAWLWLIERLARDHEVHAYALRHLAQRTDYRLHGATVHDLGSPNGRWRQYRSLLAALQADGPFDVLHAFWADPAGVTAALAARRFDVPAVVTCNSGEFVALPDIAYGLQRHWRGRTAVRIASRFASTLHVATHYMAQLARGLGYDPVTFPLGADIARIAPRSAPDEGPPWRLLQVASLNRVKDQTTLLKALALARQELDVHLDLVGEDALGGEVRRVAARLGLAAAVTFHGYVPSDQLASFHQRAHLYVQSSRHEAAGMAVLEAAAAGLPIVGTRVGFVSDWAPDGAWAVPCGDQQALARAIVRLLGAADARRAVARVAQDFAAAHDVDWSVRQLLALYERVAAGRTRKQ